MGRSQLKYRSSHGRGRGDGARSGRGSVDKTSAGDSWKPKRSGGRALGSNAARYEERHQNDALNDGDDEGGAPTESIRGATTRRQFFAGEENYRDMGEAKESYFRTKAVQRWEAEDDDDDDNATRVATSTVGIMDFAWIAQQLAAVPPSLRYGIDSKYCGDFTFGQQVQGDVREPEATDITSTPSGGTHSNIAPASTAASSQNMSHTPASTLDDLIALSASTAVTQSAEVSVVPVSVPPIAQTELPLSADGDGQENLEDWLDDVLDM